jgi:ABC-type transporter Mla maintaining outer membrane lipid asymmetry ATPase subunit MlaF
MPDAEGTGPAIELRGVVASSGGYEILSDASIAFPEGLFSVVMGAAGSATTRAWR